MGHKLTVIGLSHTVLWMMAPSQMERRLVGMARVGYKKNAKPLNQEFTLSYVHYKQRIQESASARMLAN